MRYEVTSPDGKKYEINAPDGASQDQVLTYARSQFAKASPAASSKATPTTYTPSGERPLIEDVPAAIAGNPITRFALGAASPLIGAAQLAVNLNPVARHYGVDQAVNERIANLEAMKQRGMAMTGDQGFDAYGLGGAVLNPAGLGIGRAIPQAGTMLQRIIQGSNIGSGMALATPDTSNPQTLSDMLTNALERAGIGGLAGAAAVPVGAALGGAARMVKNIVGPSLPGGAEKAAGRTALEAAGPRSPQVIGALEQNAAIVPGSQGTAGEVAAPVGSAEFAALQKLVQGRMPSEYDAIARAQDAARVAQVRTVGKTPQALEAARGVRAENAAENYNPTLMGTRVSPDSQTAIMENAIRDKYMSRASALQDQGRFATTAAQMENLSGKFVPVPGMPRLPGRLSNFPDRAQEATGAVRSTEPIIRQRMAEEKYLRELQEQLQATVGLENRSLHDFMGRPSVQRAIKEAAESAAETGSYFPQKAGDNFTVTNLQRIKQAISDDISKNPAVQGLGATQRKEMTDTVGQFTKWLSNKSPDWAKARMQYAEDSIPVNQMQIGQELEKKLVPALADAGATPAQRAAGYSQALRDAPKTIKRATGDARYDELSQILNPQQIRAVESVAEDLGRKARYEQLAKEGGEAVNRQLGRQFDGVKVPGLLDRTTMIMRTVLNRLEGRASEKTLDYLADKMRDPQAMAEIMRAATKAERKFLTDAFNAQAAATVATRTKEEQR